MSSLYLNLCQIMLVEPLETEPLLNNIYEFQNLIIIKINLLMLFTLRITRNPFVGCSRRWDI
jgi:hypothetical protein